MHKTLHHLFFFLIAALLTPAAHAYNKKDFVCPLKQEAFIPLISTYYPEALKKNKDKFKITWTRTLDRQVEEESRIKTVADLYSLAEKEIEHSISIFKVPNAEINSDAKLISFFESYKENHFVKLNKKGELKKKDAARCRQAALDFLKPVDSTLTSALTTSSTTADKTPLELTPMEELSVAISKTCLNSSGFNECLKRISKATLMCVSTEQRSTMSSQADQSFESFKGIIKKLSAKLASKTEADEHSETKTMREAHYQIKLMLTLFPSLAQQYVSLLSDQGSGLAQLSNYSDKIKRQIALTDAEESNLRIAMNSIIQICRIDFLMDVREVLKDVVTWTSVGLTVASVAFGPLFGITLLPAVLNSGTTIGFLVGINVFSHIISSIDLILMSKDMRTVWDQGKIAQMLFKIVRFQKNQMDLFIKQIQNFNEDPPSETLEGKAFTQFEKNEAKKLILENITFSDEYQSIIRLYSSLKAANFNRAKQVMNLFLFAVSIGPSIMNDRALFGAVGNAGTSGKDALAAIKDGKDFQNPMSALTTTKTTLTVSTTAASIINSLVGLRSAKKWFILEALDSAFTFQP